MLYEFSYLAPRNRKELLGILSSEGPRAKILAGGTDLLVNVRGGFARPAVILDIKKIAENHEIRWSDHEGLVIGPAVTINALIENEIVRTRFPLLTSAAGQLASHALRNRATVIGNLINASPCADMAPPLLCLGARVVLASKNGTREIALKDLFTGVKTTRMTPVEYCEKIRVPAEMTGARGGYRKHKRVRGHDIGVVSVAVLKKNGLLRVAVGSAAPTPVLAGEFKISDGLAKIRRAVLAAIRPIDDVRGSRDYRLATAGIFLERLWKEVTMGTR